MYQDYRKMLDRKDVDAVICAVPDHWHTAINIAVCKSGRDMYTEKPLTLTIDKGKSSAAWSKRPSGLCKSARCSGAGIASKRPSS